VRTATITVKTVHSLLNGSDMPT